MRDTDYAFCVARLRANERYMLSSDDYERLIEAKTYQQAAEYLVEKGFASKVGTAREIIDFQSSKLWDLLSSSVPSKKELNILCLLNDFFNIKAALKCYFAGVDANDFFIKPTTVDTSLLLRAVNEHDFSLLAGEKGDCAKKAYLSACTTLNGQNAEIIVDRAAICALKEYARINKSSVIGEICAFLCDSANIKIALRCVMAEKNDEFIDAAIGECVFIDRNRLIKSCKDSISELLEYLRSTKYSDGVSLFEKSFAEYDRWCDRQILKLCSNSKYTAFGFDPVCAFYYAKLNEIKNVRIILTCKQSGLSADEIRQRVGLDYA